MPSPKIAVRLQNESRPDSSSEETQSFMGRIDVKGNYKFQDKEGQSTEEWPLWPGCLK